MTRELQLRRLVEQSPGTATLNGVPVSGGRKGKVPKQQAPRASCSRPLYEVQTGREWPSIRAAKPALQKTEKTIRKLANRGEVLRWA